MTACGYFALLVSLGTISRFAQKTHTADHTRFYETALILGATAGNLLWLFVTGLSMPAWILVVFFLFVGIFIGCFLISLAEAVKGFPIMARRARITKGLVLIIFVYAVSKGIGSFLLFADL